MSVVLIDLDDDGDGDAVPAPPRPAPAAQQHRACGNVHAEPPRPGKGASKEAFDKWEETYAEWRYNAEALRVQAETLAQESLKKTARAAAERQLGEVGLIGEAFPDRGSVLLGRRGGPVLDLVEHLDGCTHALTGAELLSVHITRAAGAGAGNGGGSTRYGLDVRSAQPWADFITVSAVALPPGVAWADPRRHPLSTLPLHTPLQPPPPPQPSSSSSLSSQVRNQGVFAVMMGPKRAGGPAPSPVAPQAASPALPQLQKGDQIVGVNARRLADLARPVRSQLERFRSCQLAIFSQQEQVSSTPPLPSSSSFSLSSSSSSSSDCVIELPVESEAFREGVAELRGAASEHAVLLRVRRLTPEGRIYASHLNSGRPAWLLDAPLADVRRALVELLRSERNAIKFFRDYARQYMQRVLVRLEAAINAYSADFFAGRGFDLARIYGDGGAAAASAPSASSSSSSSSSSPSASNARPHPIVAALLAETKTLAEGLSRMPEHGGNIPEVLRECYVQPPRAGAADDGEVEEVAMDTRQRPQEILLS